MEEKNWGTVKLHLKEQMENKNLSKYEVCKKANLQSAQFEQYYTGQITRLDIDVLARLCHTLECNIDDLIEFWQ